MIAIWIISGLVVVFVVFIAVLLIRAFLFKPPKLEPSVIEDVPVNAERIIGNLAQMIRCKTVSFRDDTLVDEGEFEKFRALLKQLYPTVHNMGEPKRLGPSGLLYSIRGKNSEKPVVFMSHYDVVPADEDAWDKPAFEGILEDGVLWGRGTLDTKSTLLGVMEAAEQLLAQGFKPESDLYFAFSGDEETGGTSAPAIVDELYKRGVKPAMVLDEGGAVVEGIFPGLSKPCALIGIAEKGILDVELVIVGKGGHASAPPPHTPVGLLAQAVVRTEKSPFPFRLTTPVASMFRTLGRHSSFLYRIIFANLWCFMPVLDAICRKSGGELNAMLRTTCAFTMMEGSKAANVIPPEATMCANLRIIGGETTDGAIRRLKSLAKNPEITFRPLYAMNPSPESKTSGSHWELLGNAISQTWPEALVSPYLMVACSDSRHYCRISDSVYRFSAMTLSQEERATIHGHNERITTEAVIKTVQFYLRLMQNC